MTTKIAVLSTIGLIAVCLIGCVVVLISIASEPRAEERAAQLGSGAAVFCGIGCGIIWVVWASKRNKDRQKKKLPRRR